MEKNIAVQFDNVGKQYRLGLVGTGSLQHDINRWWQTTVLRKEYPYLKLTAAPLMAAVSSSKSTKISSLIGAVSLTRVSITN